MAVNYDAPRTRETEELETDPLEGLQAASAGRGVDGADGGEIVEPFKLPVTDIAGGGFDIDVTPKGEDEFAYSSCFMATHHSMITIGNGDGFPICQDCA